jgi:threonine aldolase
MNFASDNTAPVSPEILAALSAANEGSVGSYGADGWTERMRAELRAVFAHDQLAAYPVATGTAANALALATLTTPYGAVICHQEAHVATDEGGAPEFYMGGAKLMTVPSTDGKITAAQIDAAMARAIDGGIHHVLPEMVTITQATEWGTVYSPAEVRAIAEACRRHGLKLHMDGARFANALAHLGCSPAAVTWEAGVDVLSFGATKNGALAAEAVIFFDPKLATGFERRRKRAGQLWSKMRFLSVQLIAYLENDLWLRNASHANQMAQRLGDGLATVPGVSVLQHVQANEVFAAMPEALMTALRAQGAHFYGWIDVPGVDLPVVRLVTSFQTSGSDVEAFLAHAGAAKRLAA